LKGLDGETYKRSPVTGEKVPDETVRLPEYRYINPRKTEWPKADFVVGNPPFIGDKRMRDALGNGYVEALRQVYPDLGSSCDYVLYWWDKAARLARTHAIRRFGFIATNSLRQVFNRRVLQQHLSAENPISLMFAIPDHPWVDTQDGAAIRISMTVGEAGTGTGELRSVIGEGEAGPDGVHVEVSCKQGKLRADLTVGADIAGTKALRSNERLVNVGVALHARGLALDNESATRLLEQARQAGVDHPERYIRRTMNGRDVTQSPRGTYVLDLYGVDRKALPLLGPLYQWVENRVLPERRTNSRASYREKWWICGEPRPELRAVLFGLERFALGSAALARWLATSVVSSPSEEQRRRAARVVPST